MTLNKALLSAVNFLIISVNLLAQSPPVLDQGLDPREQSSKEQKKIKYLKDKLSPKVASLPTQLVLGFC
jgi:hypothetical protein